MLLDYMWSFSARIKQFVSHYPLRHTIVSYRGFGYLKCKKKKHVGVNLDGIKLPLKFLGTIAHDEQFVSHHVLRHTIVNY